MPRRKNGRQETKIRAQIPLFLRLGRIMRAHRDRAQKLRTSLRNVHVARQMQRRGNLKRAGHSGVKNYAIEGDSLWNLGLANQYFGSGLKCGPNFFNQIVAAGGHHEEAQLGPHHAVERT